METRAGQKYLEYVKSRNKVTKLTRQAKKEYEKTIAEQVKINPKKCGQYAKSKTKAPSGIPELYKDESDPDKGLATEDSEKANILADFYSSVFTEEPPGDILEATERKCTNKLTHCCHHEHKRVTVDMWSG